MVDLNKINRNVKNCHSKHPRRLKRVNTTENSDTEVDLRMN